MNFGTDDDFWDNDQKCAPSMNEHLYLQTHSLNEAPIVDNFVEKIDDKTWEFVNTWKEKYSNKDPIQDLQWFNRKDRMVRR